MKLSPNFTVAELSKSITALNRGWDNTPPPFAIENLQLLCTHILQPIRDHFGKPMTIQSGYRSPNVNRAIGGAFNSQHMIGQAADIEISGVSNADIWRFAVSLDYDQVIAEHLTLANPSDGWVHVSYNSENNRKQAMSAIGGGKYVSGLQFKK